MEFGPTTAQVFDSSPANNFFSPPAPRSHGNNGRSGHLSPAEARAYMEQIVLQLQKSSQLVTEALSDRAKPSGHGTLE
jgi:hypothetical protein